MSIPRSSAMRGVDLRPVPGGMAFHISASVGLHTHATKHIHNTFATRQPPAARPTYMPVTCTSRYDELQA